MTIHPLQPPPEPLEVKKTLRALLEARGKAKFIVFAGNQLPKYLWDHWSEELHRMGLKWQDLLRSISRNSEKALAWIAGEISWKQLTATIAEDLMSQTSREVKPKEETRKTKSLLDYF